MSKRQFLYEEGAVFALPLEDEGYGIGIITRRKPGRGNHGLFGYFFDQRFDKIPDISNISNLTPDSAVLSLMFGDLGLHRKTWTVIGDLPKFDRCDWPFPEFFKMPAPLHNPHAEVTVTQYDDKDPGNILGCFRISREEAKKYPEDSLAGAGAAEFLITQQIQLKEKNNRNYSV